MQWWCSAQAVAWTWTWRPYVGVWLLLALGIFAYWRMLRRLGPEKVGADSWPRRHRIASFAAGIFVLWLALDWPLGPLGASYLASVHMLQFLLVGLIAPVLLLFALPRAAYDGLHQYPTVMGFLEATTHPIAAFFIFNGIVSIVHLPAVVDRMMASQLGSFALNSSWLVAGCIFWWPLVAPVPPRPRFHPIGKVAYLALNIVIVRPPMLVLFYSQFPAYSIYEMAPPLSPGASPVEDQQLAAGLMKVGSSAIMAVALAVVIISWHIQRRRHEERTLARDPSRD